MLRRFPAMRDSGNLNKFCTRTELSKSIQPDAHKLNSDFGLRGSEQFQLITLKVYNVLGNEVAILVSEELSRLVSYEINFDARIYQVEFIFIKLKLDHLFKQIKWFI